MILKKLFELIQNGQVTVPDRVLLDGRSDNERFKELLEKLLTGDAWIGTLVSRTGLPDYAMCTPVALYEIRSDDLWDEETTLIGNPIPVASTIYRLGLSTSENISSIGRGLLIALWRGFSGDFAERNFLVSKDAFDFSSQEKEGSVAPKDLVVRFCELENSLADRTLTESNAFDLGYFPADVLCPGDRGELSFMSWRRTIARSSDISEEMLQGISGLRERINGAFFPETVFPKSYRLPTTTLNQAFGSVVNPRNRLGNKRQS